VRPDGTVENLKWIDGSRPDIRLNAPKGMAIHGDTLFVSDIDTVRVFSMSSQAELPGRGVPGATFLNDLTLGPDGTLYVSDSGMTGEFKPNGSDAVYRFEKSGPKSVVKGTWLAQPNGLAAGAEGLTIVANGGKAVVRIPPGSTRADTLATLPGGGVDGLIREDANNLFASSWETKTVYHIDVAGKTAHAIVTGVESPADIGFDSKRRVILIPVFTQNRIEIRKLP
jgi:sugar lactone lactonase YvrE